MNSALPGLDRRLSVRHPETLTSPQLNRNSRTRLPFLDSRPPLVFPLSPVPLIGVGQKTMRGKTGRAIH